MGRLTHSQGFKPSVFMGPDGTLKTKTLSFIDKASFNGVETIPIGVDEFYLYYRYADWVAVIVLDELCDDVKGMTAYILGRVRSSKVPEYAISNVDDQDWFEVPIDEFSPIPDEWRGNTQFAHA